MFQKTIQGPIQFETKLINANMLITLVRRYFEWFRVTKRQKSISVYISNFYYIENEQKS